MAVAAASAVAASALVLTSCADTTGGSAESSGAGASASAASPAAWVAPTNAAAMSAADASTYEATAAAAYAPIAGQVPGLWMGVWHPTQGRTSFALGLAAKPDTAAQTADTSRIGSVTKTFTATAVLQQVEQGTLALDDTIADVLPDLAAAHPDIAPVTVTQLLNMSSGLPNYTEDPDFWRTFLADPTKAWSLDDILAVALAQPVKPPGTAAYCNTNYIVLGSMLEKVTGKTASELVTAVAVEAGLTTTALTAPADNAMPAPHSDGYISEAMAGQFAQLGGTIPPGNNVTDWTVSMAGPAGAMYATIDDMLTWAGTGLGTSLLTPAMAEARLTNSTELADRERYGLGIGITDTWLVHSGAVNGWMSDVRLDRTTGAAVVTLVNVEGGLEVAQPVIEAMRTQLADSPG